MTGEPLGPEATEWIPAQRGEPRIPATGHGHVLSVGRTDGMPVVIAAGLCAGSLRSADERSSGYGGPDGLAPAFLHIVEHSPLLPPTLAGEKQRSAEHRHQLSGRHARSSAWNHRMSGSVTKARSRHHTKICGIRSR